MEKEKLGQDPAFPGETTGFVENGMSKRFYAVCCLLHGFSVNYDIENYDKEYVCKQAYELADELLKQENE